MADSRSRRNTNERLRGIRRPAGGLCYAVIVPVLSSVLALRMAGDRCLRAEFAFSTRGDGVRLGPFQGRLGGEIRCPLHYS